jgi:predicted membrane protein
MFSFSVIGRTRIHGRFKLEEKNTYTTLIGDHRIDLREADLSGDTPIKITMCKLIGSATVIVPPGTGIDVGGVVIIGNRKTSVDPGTEPSGAHLKVRHNCLIGDVVVTSKG